MVRKKMILVCDDPGVIESARTFAQHQGIVFEVYSAHEWQGQNAGWQNGGSASTQDQGPQGQQQGAKILPFPSAHEGFGGTATGRVQTINELESIAIENAINEFNGNLTEAAKALGIGRATLYRKVKQYNIDPSQARKKRAA